MYNIEKNGRLVKDKDGNPIEYTNEYVDKWKHLFTGYKLIKLSKKKNRQKESAEAESNTENGSASE